MNTDNAQETKSESGPHWDPQIAKIPVSGFIGLVVTVGLMVGFLFVVPQTRLWLFVSLPIEIVVAIILHFVGRGKI
jgi:hypothetical protein